ncbi:MAG: dicarboxylate/amino acid:cation symporter [Phycisphaeraceae bacterium]|nr:dicarboxylate/amino acid:cation symporter [Phycisphaeraceae bacterium]
MRIPFHIKILLAMVLGIVVGLIVNQSMPWLTRVGEQVPALGWVFGFVGSVVDAAGKVFVRALRFIAVPIILCSLIAGAAAMSDFGKLRRIALRTITLFLLTTMVATVIGLTLANTVRPGRFVSPEARDALLAQTQTVAQERIRAAGGARSIGETLLEAVSMNPFDSLARGDMLQVVVGALAIGIALAWLPKDKSGPVVAFFDGLSAAFQAIVTFIMRYAHWAVFALLAPIVAAVGWDAITSLLAYSLCVIGGLCVILFIEYPILIRALSPYRLGELFRAIAPAQALAFSASSSAATLPVTLKCVQTLGVPKESASLVCSLGTTINMDGTALMQSIAAVFIAQVFGEHLTIAEQVAIVVTATLASIGAPGIPSGGIVLLVAVLQAAHIPIEGIGLVLAVDRLLDMARTVVNVSGDAMTAAIVGGREGGSGGSQSPGP